MRREFGGFDRDASERLDQAYNRILSDVVAEEKKRLNKLGKGTESLLEEAKWFNAFDQPGALGYIEPRHPEVVQLRKEFNQRRDKSLKDNQNELSKLIASAKTENDLNTIVTQYLPLRQDQESKVGAALMAEGAQRAIVINRNKVLGYATEGKHNYSGKDEPTEVDMYDAVNDRFLNLNAGVEELARSCTQGRFQNDPFMAMQCLGLMMTGGTDGKSVFSFTTQITQFKKLGSCENREENRVLSAYIP